MTVHADGEFAPLQALIHDMPGGPMVNLASAQSTISDCFNFKREIITTTTTTTSHSLTINLTN